MSSGERVVAGWILERRLGSGGYGEVWQARRRHVDIVRAVKLIPIVNDGAFESWRHEIGRLETLNHPNVVRFYDADIVSEGPYRDYAWIATELCERSLAGTLRGREGHVLPAAEGERLLDAMLGALAAAHTAGMVHRDLKPANILWHRSGTWKLCDFGTARLIPTDDTHPLTQVIGTSPYMSPAAHRGRQNQAADLYALGVTLHEALRGERLHGRREGMTDSEYIKMVLDTPPTVSTDLPRRWRTVVAALIGEHGHVGASQLATWFAETRGDRPPPSAPLPAGPALPVPLTAATATATGPTVVASKRRLTHGPVVVTGPMAPRRTKHSRRHRPGAPASPTGLTEAAEARANGSSGAGALVAAPAVVPASPTVPRVHVPAPATRPPAPSRSMVVPNGSAGPAPPRRPPAPTPPRPWAVPPVAVDPAATALMGRRIFALLLDALVVMTLAFVLYLGVVVARYDEVSVSSGPGETCDVLEQQYASCVNIGNDIYVSSAGSVDIRLFVFLTGLLVFVLVQGLTGATPGKLLTGLRVVGPDGGPPGVLRAGVRTALWVVDGLPWPVPLLGWFIAVCNRRRRRLGDMVAGTVVVRRRALAPRAR